MHPMPGGAAPRALRPVAGIALVLACLAVGGCASTSRPDPAVTLPLETQTPADDSIPPDLTLDLGEGVSLRLVLIPAGTFVMGSSLPDQSPPHTVAISKPFYMGATEVTNAQMRRLRPDFDSNDPRGGASIPYQQHILSLGPDFNGDDQPAVFVPWGEALAYAEWVGERFGLVARLPSEAEWEYACRAGTTTDYPWGDDPAKAHLHANTNDPLTADEYRLGGPFPSDDGYRATAPVASFAPNAFGLYDMNGNVAEWTMDSWHEDYAGAPSDGSAWVDSTGTTRRVAKGGSFESSPGGEGYFSCTCAGRSWNYIRNQNFGTGFRIVVEAPGK